MCFFSSVEMHKQKVKEYKQKLAKEKTTEKEENMIPNRDSFKKSDLSHNSYSEKKLPVNDILVRRYLDFLFFFYFDGYIFYQFKTCRDSMEVLNSNGVCSDSDDCSTNDSYEDDDIDDDEDDDDDDDDDEEEEEEDDVDDEDEDSKIEIVFTDDVPETSGNFMKKMKKRVSFNNDIQIKEFEPRPEEHFIRRREEISEETESPEVCIN